MKVSQVNVNERNGKCYFQNAECSLTYAKLMQTSAVESLFFNDRGSLTDAKVQQSYSGMLVIARSCTLLHDKVGYLRAYP